jgi:hypothetical protein
LDTPDQETIIEPVVIFDAVRFKGAAGANPLGFAKTKGGLKTKAISRANNRNNLLFFFIGNPP